MPNTFPLFQVSPASLQCLRKEVLYLPYADSPWESLDEPFCLLKSGWNNDWRAMAVDSYTGIPGLNCLGNTPYSNAQQGQTTLGR
ncbi:hypothetical protein NLI96_g9485 [Meripilus lineatus]|uniref:Uncharacterized protein n=1 Tax=Meripilus lineatus TaxID=2056292 RepID=A0AAD5UVD2_9APHY|nr:hypothetical protein NLI96_g9485 [Physisporinus lineatus]